MAQVRGENLKKLLREKLKELSAAADGKYVYSPSELQRHSGVSRPTLSKHSDYIDEVLKDLEIDKKFAKGQAVIGFMREKIARLEKDKLQLKGMVEAFRQHHAKIYEGLYYESANLAHLVKPIVLKESKEAGRCILCKHEIDSSAPSTKTNKVVPLSSRVKGR